MTRENEGKIASFNKQESFEQEDTFNDRRDTFQGIDSMNNRTDGTESDDSSDIIRIDNTLKQKKPSAQI